MKKLISLLLAFALLALPAALAGTEPAPGDAMPDFSVELADGSVFTLSEALESYDAVMINIWATWCGPCCMEFPYMESAYSAYSDRVALVCLSPFDSNEDIAAFKAENGLTILPMGYDSVGLGDALVQEGYPTTIIVDKFGNYAYYECGSMLSVGQFTRIFDYFLSDSYTESEIVEEIPEPKPTVANPTSEELSAFSDENITLSCNYEDEYAWPFLPAENGLTGANSEYGSYAELTARLTANAGDVLAFDYALNTETMCGILEVYVNGEYVTARTGFVTGTLIYSFEEDGEYDIDLCYTIYNASDTGSYDCTLSDFRLVSGAERELLLATQPAYPQNLEGSALSLDVLGENVREIVFDDTLGILEACFGDARYYIAGSDTVTLRGSIGAEVSPYLACLYGDWDEEWHILSTCDYDESGYYADIALSNVEIGYSNTYCYLYDDFTTGNSLVMAIVFADEYNADYFAEYELEGTVSWTYCYVISVVDENGDPVTGVLLNVCDETTCTAGMVDSKGIYTFTGSLYPYSIHVLAVPEGYSFDTSAELIMEGSELTIVIPHA